MKPLLRPILLAFLAFMSFSCWLILRQSARLTAANRRLMQEVQAQNEASLLEEQRSLQELELVVEPFWQEKAWRDTNFIKRQGEQVLDLANFTYTPAPVGDTDYSVVDHRASWRAEFDF